MEENSVVQIYGFNAHECGYCKASGDTSISFGVVADRMTCYDYLSLMYIGWRRSGNYFYKPVMYKTCCPQYTIRLKVDEFVPSKEHKKVLKKVRKSPKPESVQEEALADANIVFDGPLSIQLTKAIFTEERFNLYKKYQINVHHDDPDDVTEQSYTRFLVASPLIDGRKNLNEADLKWGTFHQLYRIGSRLVAVGVVDILPNGLSAVYFYYDVDYKHLALGKYSALMEIEFTKKFNLEYYYMGYYIHNCEKMNYKAKYHPSELLCPTKLSWVTYEKCIATLNKYSFSPLNEELQAERNTIVHSDQNTSANNLQKYAPTFQLYHAFPVNTHISGTNTSSSDWSECVRIDIGLEVYFTLSKFKRNLQQQVKPVLTEWSELVGPELSERIIVRIT